MYTRKDEIVYWYRHSCWRSNAFEDARFWFCPNLLKFAQIQSLLPKFRSILPYFAQIFPKSKPILPKKIC